MDGRFLVVGLLDGRSPGQRPLPAGGSVVERSWGFLVASVRVHVLA